MTFPLVIQRFILRRKASAAPEFDVGEFFVLGNNRKIDPFWHFALAPKPLKNLLFSEWPYKLIVWQSFFWKCLLIADQRISIVRAVRNQMEAPFIRQVLHDKPSRELKCCIVCMKKVLGKSVPVHDYNFQSMAPRPIFCSASLI